MRHILCDSHHVFILFYFSTPITFLNSHNDVLAFITLLLNTGERTLREVKYLVCSYTAKQWRNGHSNPELTSYTCLNYCCIHFPTPPSLANFANLFFCKIQHFLHRWECHSYHQVFAQFLGLFLLFISFLSISLSILVPITYSYSDCCIIYTFHYQGAQVISRCSSFPKCSDLFFTIYSFGKILDYFAKSPRNSTEIFAENIGGWGCLT